MNTISNEQLEANRQNAKLGGVKTEDGKAVSRYNAIKHGLLSKETLLKTENEMELLELGRRLRSYYKPANEIENILIDRVVSCLWRIKRAVTAESQMIDQEITDLTWQGERKSLGAVFQYDFINHDAFTKHSRYEAGLERSMLKALHELERIQAKRSGQDVPLPSVVDINVMSEK